MMEEPSIAQAVGGAFDHVLVDEYQDTNRLQERILLALKPDGRGLTVVGDDAQSITPSAPQPCATSSTSPPASRSRPRS